MALQLDYTTDQDVLVPNAYFVIEQIAWSKNAPSLVTAPVYKSQAARNQGKRSIGYVSFTFDPDTGTGGIQAKAYNAMKLLPEMAGAVDV